MKKLYVLCLLTLAAVAADIFLFHAAPVEAQTQRPIGKVHILSVSVSAMKNPVDVTDSKVLGFSCVTNLGYVNDSVCFIATGD